MIKPAIARFIERSAFFPTLSGAFVNPFYIARRGLGEAIREYSTCLSGRLLDIGCGSKPYAHLFRVEEYVGLEIDSAKARAALVADHFYDGHRFPFESESFDAVLCNQVLEHVFNPAEFLTEIHRVLKRDGGIVLTVPFVWDEHEQPWDYARYSSFGLTALFEESGFTIERRTKINANISILFQLFNAYLYKLLPNSPRVHLLVCATIMAPVSLIGQFLGRVLPANEDLYLDQIVFARKARI